MMIVAAATLMPNDKLPGGGDGTLLRSIKQHYFLLSAHRYTETNADTICGGGGDGGGEA